MAHMWPDRFIEMPPAALLAFAVVTAVTLACLGQWYVHRRFQESDFVRHNEVGGFIIAVAGTLYAVVLGFLTAVAWQQFAEARQLVAQESAAAADAWHSAIGLPYGNRTRVRSDVLQYAQVMVRSEWPEMRRGQFDKQADLIIMDGIAAAGTFNPNDLMKSNSQNATLQQLTVIHDIRQRRLAANNSALSGFEWFVLFLGAVCIICFCWLFGLTNRRVHLVMTATVTIIITSVLVLLFELQYPFRSDMGITPAGWTATIDHIHIMQTGSQMQMRM